MKIQEVKTVILEGLRPFADKHGYKINKSRFGIEKGKTVEISRNNQVNKWNRESGYYRFDSRIIQEFPAGPNARLRALEAEKRNANRLRNQRELDPEYHKRP